jgi:hypothetical protein
VNDSGEHVDRLIRALKERAADPRRRVDHSQSIFDKEVRTLDLSGLLSQLGRVRNDLQLLVAGNPPGKIDPELAARAEKIGRDMETPVPSVLPGAASQSLLVETESRLSLQLPPLLRRVYAEVADGGFGPGNGLLPLADVASTYRDLLGGEALPRNRSWPAKLLPIVQESAVMTCIDLSSDGNPVVKWDPDGLREHSSESLWARSFTEEATSLSEWLERWIDRPSALEAQQEQLGARIIQSQIELARQSRARIAAMTAAERRAMGLPEVGWERVVWGGIGLEDDTGS